MESAPLAGSFFGFFPPMPAFAANACRSAAIVKIMEIKDE